MYSQSYLYRYVPVLKVPVLYSVNQDCLKTWLDYSYSTSLINKQYSTSIYSTYLHNEYSLKWLQGQYDVPVSTLVLYTVRVLVA